MERVYSVFHDSLLVVFEVFHVCFCKMNFFFESVTLPNNKILLLMCVLISRKWNMVVKILLV